MAAKKSDITTTKHYVLDTNVLIHDPQSMLSFEDNAVWIPVEVLEELDRFKSESTTRGANAREVHRRLSERFRDTEQMRTGVKLQHVPYRATPAGIQAVANGEVTMGLFNTPTVIGLIKGGKLKAIAVTSKKRSDLLPDVPTMIESGVKDYVVNTWMGRRAKGPSASRW